MKRKSEIIQKMEDKILKKKKLWIAALLSLAMVTSMVPVQKYKKCMEQPVRGVIRESQAASREMTVSRAR
ncbi:hypothetical protein DXB96_13405 [Clostridium sp. OM07-10AC]|nr:hypothetical protein DXB96_13405 [Clostridium sp. OM07-10AC]